MTTQRTAALLIGITIMGGWLGLAAVSSSAAPVNGIALAQLPPKFADEADCAQCSNCVDPDKHDLSATGWDRRYGESDHSCTSVWATGTCPNRHPESQNCSGGKEEDSLLVATKEHLWELVASGMSTADFRDSVRAFGPAVTFNRSRQSVQVIGCDRQVVLSIPLTDSQAWALNH
jgi:hypothetical protein